MELGEIEEAYLLLQDKINKIRDVCLNDSKVFNKLEKLSNSITLSEYKTFSYPLHSLISQGGVLSDAGT